MIGAGPSAYDISRDIAVVAKEVHLSSRTSTSVGFYKLVNLGNVRQHAEVRTLLYMYISINAYSLDIYSTRY